MVSFPDLGVLQESASDRVSVVGNKLAALANEMEPQTVVEIAKTLPLLGVFPRN
jgi:hypothetical protein